MFDAYLDGNPQTVDRRKLARTERDSLFWSSTVVSACESDDWASEAGILVLVRYLSQTQVLVDGLVRRLAGDAPSALVVAVRRSRLVATPKSPHFAALRDVRDCSPLVDEECRVQDSLVAAHRERLDELALCQERLAGFTAFDLLVLASLHAFERLVAHSMTGTSAFESAGGHVDSQWAAINDLLIWKLETAPLESLGLDERAIAHSLKRHLMPLLFPVPGSATELVRLRRDFAGLLAAQLELNEFIARSLDAHCYDDSMRYTRVGERSLEIEHLEPAAEAKWLRDGAKLERLPGYWMHRAFHDFVASDLLHQPMGRPENENENRLAYVRAMATRLRLREVYGVGETVSAGIGETADLFQALLSLELTSRFFMLDFIVPFGAGAERAGDWLASLRSLAMNGWRDGMQNRLPLTWCKRADKIRNITGWTVTPAHPKGSARMAAAILDFWTYDLQAIAQRLRQGEPGIEPRLSERPYLNFGSMLVQLPWVVGLQNCGTAAINNLRRLAARRGEASEETRRIERNLARELEARGLRVVLNWQPPAAQRAVGDVDIAAAIGGHLFVFEVKSTYIRQSMRDAWLHASTTLRKAGLQLRRKVPALRQALESDVELQQRLGVDRVPPMDLTHAWIVDTSIECDHERFSGYLKVSLEEVILALRDDCHLLDDSEGLASGRPLADTANTQAYQRAGLYPTGFSAERFTAVVEVEMVWEKL